jgi:hypothetical protein
VLPLSVRLTDVTGAVVEQEGVVTSFDDLATFDMGEQLAACDEPIFADGFESGSTSAWTSTVP